MGKIGKIGTAVCGIAVLAELCFWNNSNDDRDNNGEERRSDPPSDWHRAESREEVLRRILDS